MNSKFAAISLAVGGSHYPTVNSALQQQFGETVVRQVLDRIAQALGQADEQATVADVLTALDRTIREDFGMPEWNPHDELQRIFDGFESE